MRISSSLWRKLQALFKCVASVCVMSAAIAVQADDVIDKEYQVKAAYLYNILKFVNWPKDKNNLPLMLCVYGDNPFGDLLKQLEQRTVAERPIKINYVTETIASTCDVVYINSQSTAETKKIISMLNAKRILTVGDQSNFIELGGIVGFVTEQNSIRFKLNMTHAKALGLMLNSQLTETAVEVR